MTKALYVPCGELEAVRIVDIGRADAQLPKLQELVGGWVEHVQYDLDADGWCDEDGRSKHRTTNRRVMDYLFEHSDAAKQGRLTEAHRGHYRLVGDVVFTGLEKRGYATDVPQRLVEAFGLTLGQAVEL